MAGGGGQAVLSVSWCLLEKGQQDTGLVPGHREISAAALRAESGFCGSAAAGLAQHAAAGPRTTQCSSLQGCPPTTFTVAGCEGLASSTDPPGPACSRSCRKPPLPSMLGPFPLAELLSDFIFIISPPRSFCVVYVALAPAAGLALSGFFSPPLLVRWQMLPN